MGKWRTEIDILNVGLAFVVIILLGLRVESAIGSDNKQALFMLATVGLFYAFYLFYYDIFPQLIQKLSRKADTNFELPVKLLTPFVMLCIVFLVRTGAG